MRRRSLPALLAAAMLVGCGGDGGPELNNQQLAKAIENVAEARPEPKSEPPGPALIPIRPEDLRAGLRAGAACEFSEEGRLLFASDSTGRALARINAFSTRFVQSGPMEASGGFFVNERYSISIGRLTDSGLTVEGATTWPARLVLTDRRRRDIEELRLEGVWRCRT